MLLICDVCDVSFFVMIMIFFFCCLSCFCRDFVLVLLLVNFECSCWSWLWFFVSLFFNVVIFVFFLEIVLCKVLNFVFRDVFFVCVILVVFWEELRFRCRSDIFLFSFCSWDSILLILLIIVFESLVGLIGMDVFGVNSF